MEKHHKPIIVNLFGGPGSGKSTTAAGVFHKLKLNGVNCELVTEFAKHLTWKKDYNSLGNQVFVFGKQHDRMFHLKDKVDVIITDSPLVMGLAYCDWTRVSPSFRNFVIDEFTREDSENVNIFLNRVKKYVPIGRSQTEEEAKEKDSVIKVLLTSNHIHFDTIDGDSNAHNIIADAIIEKLKEKVVSE
jgi:nicotinamide riboside kinase